MADGQGSALNRGSTLAPPVDAAQALAGFLDTKRSLAPETRWHYRQVLVPFVRRFPELPWKVQTIIDYLFDLPQRRRPSGRKLDLMSLRSYYKTIRTFYAWVKENREPKFPRLPYYTFWRKPRRKS